MVEYALFFTKQAQKDAKKIFGAGLRPQVERLLDIIRLDPFYRHPPFEKLRGDLKGAYSRRINIHHRLAYQVMEAKRTVKVLRMWSHCGDQPTERLPYHRAAANRRPGRREARHL